MKQLMTKSKDRNSLLRELPSVDALLKTDTARGLANELGPTRVTSLARLATEDLRQRLLLNSSQDSAGANGDDAFRSELLKQAEQRLVELHRIDEASGVHRVINATGVVLHTNLGRAPLSDAADVSRAFGDGRSSTAFAVEFQPELEWRARQRRFSR